ncbi:MAG: hypothetical protein LBB41_06590, partial [Prevotellaceae bacterium]|nr:hypothetical protein [Prevotellaceae bacterium]
IEKLNLTIFLDGVEIGKTYLTNFHLPGSKTSPAPIYLRVEYKTVLSNIWEIFTSGDLLGRQIGLRGDASISERYLPLSVDMMVGEFRAATSGVSGIGTTHLKSYNQTLGFAKRVLKKVSAGDYNLSDAERRMVETLRRTGSDPELAAANYWNKVQQFTQIGALKDLGNEAHGFRKLKDTADFLIAKPGNINYDVFSDGLGTFAVNEDIQENAHLNNGIFSKKSDLRKAIRASKIANNALVYFNDISDVMGDLVTPSQIFARYNEVFGVKEYAKNGDEAYLITLYNIAKGQKFIWAKRNNQEGIADIFGYTTQGKNFRKRNYKTSEKKFYKDIINEKNGISPVSYVESITDYDVDDTATALDIRNAAYEAIQNAPSPEAALQMLVRLMPMSDKQREWKEYEAIKNNEDLPF